MDKATFGLIGVILGIVLTVAKEWWFDKAKSRKELEFLSINVICLLDSFISGCVDVVSDDGLSYGQYDAQGRRVIQVKTAEFQPQDLDVNWKCLPRNLMYEVLNLRSEVEIANRQISAAFEYGDGAPDYSDGFQERQFHYASLGLKAHIITQELRRVANFPPEAVRDWDLVEFFRDKKWTIRAKIRKRQYANAKTVAKFNKATHITETSS